MVDSVKVVVKGREKVFAWPRKDKRSGTTWRASR
ncbi:hypothetical protein I656_02640 [Geobacillus sp. WSUCF1]|nr:hypothetical protein I656_02640 [Geobacillus sp. WSUCF1]